MKLINLHFSIENSYRGVKFDFEFPNGLENGTFSWVVLSREVVKNHNLFPYNCSDYIQENFPWACKIVQNLTISKIPMHHFIRKSKAYRISC